MISNDERDLTGERPYLMSLASTYLKSASTPDLKIIATKRSI